MKAMTLRLPDDLYEAYRREAFEQRTSISALIVARLERTRPTQLGCDVCGAPPTNSRIGGIRLCANHGGAAQPHDTGRDAELAFERIADYLDRNAGRLVTTPLPEYESERAEVAADVAAVRSTLALVRPAGITLTPQEARMAADALLASAEQTTAPVTHRELAGRFRALAARLEASS